jgi:hypothetical protein
MSMNFENFDVQDCRIITKAVKSGNAGNVEVSKNWFIPFIIFSVILYF